MSDLKETLAELKTLESLHLTPEEKAFGIYDNYQKFVNGESSCFIAYFPYEITLNPESPEAQYYQENGINADHQQVERAFLHLLGVDVADLEVSEDAIAIDYRNNTTLYRWSTIFRDEEGNQTVFDAMYQACAGSEEPLRPVATR